MKKLAVYVICALALVCCGSTKAVDQDSNSLSAPDGLRLHSATQTSLTFQWNPVSGAKGYKWTVTASGQKVSDGSVSGRNVTVDGLQKASDYRFGVCTLGDGSYESEYAWVDASTLGDGSSGEEGEQEDLTAHYAEFKIPECEEDGVARAFPGAEGGGMWASGGRGGTVYHVTNLNDSGPGSLRYGLTLSGPRTIVFDVAGIIALNSTLNVTKGDVTIAGQTAPGDGICLKNYTFRISASNVIVRYIRCRMGDEKATEDDAMQILNRNEPYTNIIIDHCSVSWCTDECASFYGMKDFSFQWNIVSESLRNSVHDKGAHGYGGIWGGEDASYHHNLLAHHDSRNPRIDHDYVSTQKGPVSLVNNVIYNWKGNTCYGGESSNSTGTYRMYNIVNNYYKPGPVTPSNHLWLVDPTVSCSNCTGASGVSTIVPGHFYLSGNVLEGKSSVTQDNWTGTTASSNVISKIKQEHPFGYESNLSYLSIHSAQNGFNAVLEYAGASFARDEVDARIARETSTGTYTYQGSNTSGSKVKDVSTKGLIDSQTDVGGWPEYKASESQTDRNRDSDGDGMPDWFEKQFGLSTSKDDGASVNLDKYGRYTNLEMYLHYLVKESIAAQNANSEYTNL